MPPDTSWHDEMVATSKLAEKAFGFLSSLGFRLKESKVSPGNNARYDGWHQHWERRRLARNELGVRIEYYEWEFNVVFNRKDLAVGYIFLDMELHHHSSGYQGTMFPPDKLPRVIEQTAQDIRANYQEILSGDESIWNRIRSIADDWKQQAQKDREEYERENAHRFERRDAAEAFRLKNYATVVKLLQPISGVLNDIERKKLDYARKHNGDLTS
jgi:hypothetical protein